MADPPDTGARCHRQPPRERGGVAHDNAWGGLPPVNNMGDAQSEATLRLTAKMLGLGPDGPPPRVIGIDDWARRKGQTYGTIVVDLEQQQVVDLLPDRTAPTVTTWLQHQPQVEIISRDRGSAYAEGAATGAPHAVQVADRWHRLRNLGETLERVLHAHAPAIKRALVKSGVTCLRNSDPNVP